MILQVGKQTVVQKGRTIHEAIRSHSLGDKKSVSCYRSTPFPGFYQWGDWGMMHDKGCW